MYRYSGSGRSSASLATKFAKSKTLSLTLTATPAAASTAARSLDYHSQYSLLMEREAGHLLSGIPGEVPVNPQINITDQFIFVGNQGDARSRRATSSWVAISGPQGSRAVCGSIRGMQWFNICSCKRFRLGCKVYAGTGNGQGEWSEQKGLMDRIPVAVEADNQVHVCSGIQELAVFIGVERRILESDSCQLTDTRGDSGHWKSRDFRESP